MATSNSKPLDSNNETKSSRFGWIRISIIAILMLNIGQVVGILLSVGIALLNNEENSHYRFLSESYLPMVGVFSVLILYSFFIDKNSKKCILPATFGGLKGNTLRLGALGYMTGVFMISACVLVSFMHHNVLFSIGYTDAVYFIVAFVLVCIQSFSEEFLIHGYALHEYMSFYNPHTSVLLSSLLFALLHLVNAGLTVTAIISGIMFSTLLAFICYKFDSLWGCCALHASWNYFQNIIYGIPNSGLVSGGSLFNITQSEASLFFFDPVFGIEGTWLAISVYTCLLIALLLKKKS